jgi:hypothetical protein
VEVDRVPYAPIQAGIQELLRVFDGGSTKEGEFNNQLVGFLGADNAVMGVDGGFWVRRLYSFYSS